MTRPLAGLGALELLELYRNGDASPSDAAQTALEAIAALNPQINSIVLVTEERAREAARESERRWAAGEPRPLEGVPFAAKDVMDVAGLVTTVGSRLYLDRVATETAEVVRRVEAAGGVLVAKEATTEFAVGGPHNPAFGPVRNPWDLDRWSGGSSTGSGASLAARLYPLSLASDAGGSIRLPAAWSGVVGLKTTQGAIPRHGVFPLSWTTETIGPMGRSAADVRALFDVMRGFDERDPRSAPTASPSTPADVRGLRIGIPASHFFDLCDDDVRAAYDQMLAVLVEAGARTVEIDIPSAADAHAVGYQVLFTEAAVVHAIHRDRLADYDPVTVRRIDQGLLTPATDYLRALQFRHELQLEFEHAFAGADLIAVPATPSTAPRLDDLTVSVNGERLPLYEAQSKSTMIGNLTGLPGLVFPTGLAADGCPVAAQLIAPPHREDLALLACESFQAATDHHRRLPELLTGTEPAVA
jgi:aspartyl-tRNA(Asn)/glutamyl-tRNA(Gln) amidotransferase subunit A